PHAGRGGDERSRGRDVDRAGAVATGSGRVHEVPALWPHREHVIAHRLGTARDLVGRLSFDTQRDQKASDLSRCGFAAHDRAHHLSRVLARQVVAVEQPLQRLLDHVRSRRFRAISRPRGVSTDWGRYWTPTTPSRGWRTASTPPACAWAELAS